MSINKILGAVMLGCALALSALSVAGVPDANAQTNRNAGQTTSIRDALEQQIGKRAKLTLVSGKDVEGKVVQVTDKAVIVDELTGMEFYGATVRLDQVAAVTVRTRSQ